MKIIANTFLILFLNAAGIGIADVLFSHKLAAGSLSALHSFTTGLAIFFGLLIYIGFAVNRHLPKLVLAPPLLYLFWGLLDFWPLEMATANYRYYAAISQLLLGLLVLQLNLAQNKKSRLMVTSQFDGPAFSVRTLLRFCLLNIPLFPLILLILCFGTAATLLEQQSAGFMRLKPNGLYMVEKEYRKDTKKILLTSMIHLGQHNYYNSLNESLQGQQALLLAEGVTDRTGRLNENFSYQKLAGMLGLTTQSKKLIEGRLVDEASLDQLSDRKPKTTDILPADIDLLEFDEQTIRMLNAVGRYVLDSDSFADGFQQFNRWAREHTNVHTNQIVMDDLIQKRNRKVLSYLPKALQKYDTLVIPWGALHMPGLETAIRNRGFSLQNRTERRSIDFLLLPYEKLWE
ncbi:hypothetical protein [Malonomonas rubra]|uniref:hypothetical protein n=1 Tax=Malonomonas rubra TaxID=57040 RepID=UPI0026ED2EBA|nr:hypothetical protein [Malonomonas rubra]